VHRFYLTGLLFFSQIIFGQSVQAQMYQWADPETGTTQLSGKPPAWYRSAEGGPRVFVFNRGKIVDDTGIEVSDEKRNSLRTKAFIDAEADRVAANQKAMEAARLKAAMEKNSERESEEETHEHQVEPSEVIVMEEPEDEELIEKEMSSEEESVEKLKELIADWEDKRTEEARALLKKEADEK
jgi:hypothetical protein